MTPARTLADYWTALCPQLPPAWDSAANRGALVRMAGRMAPIPRVALECRLDSAEPRLDLQQCVVSDDGEPALLRDFLESTQPRGGAWERLHRFCEAWAEPASVLRLGIAEIFLEFDLDARDRAAVAPSLFFAVGADGWALAQSVIEVLFAGSFPSRSIGHLEQCFASCPAGASVGYLGVMLGRQAGGLRLNVKRLGRDQLAPFLSDIGWGGSRRGVEEWAEWAYDRVDRVTVCLDVGDEVYPHLGLECMLTLQPSVEPRWQAVLSELTDAGLCSSENAGAFLTVPSVLRPPDTSRGWPAPWIAADVSDPSDRFSTSERRLSHLKLTVMDQQAVLKGYWGAGHVWRVATRPDWELESAANGSVSRALISAVDFLVSAQSHTGRWSDFLMPAGPSDEWVTAFVAASLLEVPAEAARIAAQGGWRALAARRRGEHGWGYNRLTPPDADSTAWALRLASGLDIRDQRIEPARHFLAGHLLADGGVTTYAAGDPIRRFAGLPDDASIAGWQAVHACVTAAAAPVLGGPAETYLAGAQAADGSWSGYWWWDDEYTTALAAEAVPSGRRDAVAWSARRVDAGGVVRGTDGRPSPWAAAWCVRILRLGRTPGARAACDRAVRWLVSSQRSDGSWPASAHLRVPMPAHVDPTGERKRIEGLDLNRVFTTAAVAAALGMDAAPPSASSAV